MKKVENTRTNIWPAFVSYIENIYYKGILQNMSRDQVQFHYQEFKQQSYGA